MDYKNIEHLQAIGLQETEAMLYVALLETGISSPSALAKKTGINRTTVYRTLERLLVQGLVNTVKKKKKVHYQPASPQALVALAQERVQVAKRAEQKAAKVAPGLQELLRMASHKPAVSFYEGLEGVRQIYRDHVTDKDPYEMLGYSNVSTVVGAMGEVFLKTYITDKNCIGITSRGIFPDTEADQNYTNDYYSRVSPQIIPKVRFIPAEQFPHESEITVYGQESVSVINLYEDKMIGVIIQDPTIHNMMRMIFELAWRGAGNK